MQLLAAETPMPSASAGFSLGAVGKVRKESRSPAAVVAASAAVEPVAGATTVGGADADAGAGAGAGAADDADDDDDDSSDEDGLHELLASRPVRAPDLEALLDNLNCSVDDLYYVCELESSSQGCAEAIAALADRMADFEELMQRIQMQERFDKAGASSIAWEVQTSPLHAPPHGARRPGRPRRLQRRRARAAVAARRADKQASCADESSDSDNDGVVVIAGHAKLTIDVPSDDDDCGGESSAMSVTTATTAAASAALDSGGSSSSSYRASKRSPSKRFVAFEKRLLTPERRKKTAEETLRDQIERQERAEKQRSMLLSEKQGRLREAASRAARVTAAQEEQRLKRRLFMDERHEKAEQLHEAHVQAILSKAEKETQKVKEVRFINEMMQANRFLDYKEKLEDRESRRETHSSQRAAKTALDERQAAAQEKRRSMEAERKLKLQEKEDRRLETQRRRALEKEKAQERKEAKAEELARRAEEVQTREQQELERLEQELVKRLDEVSRRKQEYLASVKEKAAKVQDIQGAKADGSDETRAVRFQRTRRKQYSGTKPATNGSNQQQAGGGKVLSLGNAAAHGKLGVASQLVASRVQQAHSAAASIDCPEDIDQPDCSPPTSFRGTKLAQADTGMLCTMIPITHRTRATKKRLRKLRQILSSVKAGDEKQRFGVQSDWDRQEATLLSPQKQRLSQILQHARKVIVQNNECRAEQALLDLLQWIREQDASDVSISWCHAGAVDLLVEVSMKAQSPGLRTCASKTLLEACRSYPEIWNAVLFMHHVAPFVDALAATLCIPSTEEARAEVAPITSYKAACAALITAFLRETLEQPAQFLSAALVEYVARSRIVELTINSLLLIVAATTTTASIECCPASTTTQHEEDAATVATKHYVDACFRLLQAMNARVQMLFADASKPAFEPLVPSADVIEFFSSDTAMAKLASLGVNHVDLTIVVQGLMVGRPG